MILGLFNFIYIQWFSHSNKLLTKMYMHAATNGYTENKNIIKYSHMKF